MTLPDAVANDWQMWDGLEAATLNVSGPAGVYTTQAIGSGAACVLFRKSGTKEAAPSGGVYTAFRQRVIVPANQLPAGVAPKPADQIVRAADGSTLTVLAVDSSVYESLYFLDTIDLVLAASLRDAATIYRPGNATDAAGKRVPNLVALVSDLPCRVQQQEARRDDAFDAPAQKARATAYIGQQVFCEVGDVLEYSPYVPPPGTRHAVRYKVIGWKNPDRLDELMTLDLEERQ